MYLVASELYGSTLQIRSRTARKGQIGFLEVQAMFAVTARATCFTAKSSIQWCLRFHQECQVSCRRVSHIFYSSRNAALFTYAHMSIEDGEVFNILYDFSYDFIPGMQKVVSGSALNLLCSNCSNPEIKKTVDQLRKGSETLTERYHAVA